MVADSEWRRERLIVLCYHGISLGDEHEWNPELYMPAAQLRDRMRRLREARYNVLPLGEAVQRMHEGDLPPRSVAVTFDDGCYDFLARALPVLREFDIPTTNYISTYYSRFQRPVFDTALSYLLWKGRERGHLVLPTQPEAQRLALGTKEQRAHAWHAIHTRARREALSGSDKDALLASIATALGIDYDAWIATRMLQQMSEAEIRTLPHDLVDVQLHTHRHRMPAERRLFAQEIADNRDALDELTPGAEARAHFCYPSGRFDLRAARWLAELDVRTAVTCDADICTTQDHPLLLPRFTDTSLQPTAVFDAWVSGLYSRLPWSPALREQRRERHVGACGVPSRQELRTARPMIDDVPVSLGATLAALGDRRSARSHYERAGGIVDREIGEARAP